MLIRSICCALILSICPAAFAQLPTATGRTITMANSAWSLFIPSDYVPRGNVADLIVHFHGDPATFRNNAKYAKLNAIIVTVNYGGLSSAYQTPFQSDTSLFSTLISDALTRTRNQSDFPDTLVWDKLAVSSFSAGYGAVRELLKSPTYYGDIDMLLAADSIHAGFVSYPSNLSLISSQMTDWRQYANDAKNGAKTFVVSHSQVDPVTYASTTLTANDLLTATSLSAQSFNVAGLGTLNYYRKAQSGKFTVLGATGNDAAAHSKHLQYIGDYLEELPLAKVPEPVSVGLIAPLALMMLRNRRDSSRSCAPAR